MLAHESFISTQLYNSTQSNKHLILSTAIARSKLTKISCSLFLPRHQSKGLKKNMYGRTGCQLVKELACVEKGHLPPYNNTLFEEVIQECNEHHLTLQSLIRKMQDERLDVQTARNADHYGALVHHLSILRNKRSLMAYMYNRVEVIRSFRWKLGPVLPEEILGKLDKSEEIYFEKHSSALEAYMEEVDLDLTVDTVPPKDPYIHVRVLDDIGEAWLSDRFVNLARHSMHFLKRTDAEQYISQGLMEELMD